MGWQTSIASSSDPTMHDPTEEILRKPSNPREDANGNRAPEGEQQQQERRPLPSTTVRWKNGTVNHDSFDEGTGGMAAPEGVRQSARSNSRRSPHPIPPPPTTTTTATISSSSSSSSTTATALSRSPFRRRFRDRASGKVPALLRLGWSVAVALLSGDPRWNGWFLLPLATLGSIADARPIIVDDNNNNGGTENGMETGLLTICFGIAPTSWNVALAPFGHDPAHDRYKYDAILNTLPVGRADLCGDTAALLRESFPFPEEKVFGLMVDLGGDCDVLEKATNALMMQKYRHPGLKYVIFYSDEAYDPLKHDRQDFPGLSLELRPSYAPSNAPSDTPSLKPSTSRTVTELDTPSASPSASPTLGETSTVPSFDAPTLGETSTVPSFEWASPSVNPSSGEESSGNPSMRADPDRPPPGAAESTGAPSVVPTTAVPTETNPPTTTLIPTETHSPTTYTVTYTTTYPTTTAQPTTTYPPTTWNPTTSFPTSDNPKPDNVFRDRSLLVDDDFDLFLNDMRNQANKGVKTKEDKSQEERDSAIQNLEESDTMVFMVVSTADKDILLSLLDNEFDIRMSLHQNIAPIDVCQYAKNDDISYVSRDDEISNGDGNIPPRRKTGYPTSYPTNPPTNSYNIGGNRNRDNYSDNAPGTFTIFKFFLFGLLIASPCCRALHLWYSGGGRIRLRRGEGDDNRVIGLQYIPPMDNWFGTNEGHEGDRPVPRLTQEQVMNLPEILYRKPFQASEEFHPDATHQKATGVDVPENDGGDDDDDDDNNHVYNEEDDDDRSATADPAGNAVLASATMPPNNSTACTTDGPPFDAGGETETESVTSERFFENEPSAATTTATLVPIRLRLPSSPERVPSTFTCTTQGFSTDDEEEEEDDDDMVREPPVSPRAIVIKEDLPPDEEEPREPPRPEPPSSEPPPEPPMLCPETDEAPPLSFRTQRRLGAFTTTTCTSCSICLDDFVEGERLRLLPKCGHAFHTECILPWLTERQGCCPLCKTEVLVEANSSSNNDDGNNNSNNNNNEGGPAGTDNNNDNAGNTGIGGYPGTMASF